MSRDAASYPASRVEALRRPARPPRRAPLMLFRREVQLVVTGRASGAGRSDEVVARATSALRDAGARVRAHVTADEDELAAAVRGADDRRVVLVGGDGTVHALANLDLPALPPAALLPAGRANHIAPALGIPVDWRAAAELAVRGRAAGGDVLEILTPARRLFAVEGVSGGVPPAPPPPPTGHNPPHVPPGGRAPLPETAPPP